MMLAHTPLMLAHCILKPFIFKFLPLPKNSTTACIIRSAFDHDVESDADLQCQNICIDRRCFPGVLT